MSKLALFGGTPAVSGTVPRYNSISEDDISAAAEAMQMGPLSGFLGGNLRGGQYVQRLEELWAAKFGIAHAVACNSATSGLMAAAFAAGLREGDKFCSTPFTMSATVAAPRILGATPVWMDVCPETFNMARLSDVNRRVLKAQIVTNLFGLPCNLHEMRAHADKHGHILIEDNAQSILAAEGGKYAGTIGHMGVFSLNVHKHIQVGEGGIIVTNEQGLANHLRKFINHAELAEGGRYPFPGLNLRMTEYTAAMAIRQLSKVDWIVSERVSQAEAVIKAMDVEWLTPPKVPEGRTHVYYNVAFLFDAKKLGLSRERFVEAMAAEGVPLVAGYVTPLTQLKAFEFYHKKCHVAEELHEKTLLYFSNCEYSPSTDQIAQIADAVRKIEANITQLRE